MSSDPPFHRQEVDQGVPVLPKGVSVPDSELSQHATYVDVDSDDEGFNKTNYAEYNSSGEGLSSSAHVTEDGRISVSLDLKNQLPDLQEVHAKDVKEFAVDLRGWKDVPKMNIVIMIVGSRGVLRIICSHWVPN
jgi:sterol 3beta-glucosyltransferase